ncbi:MAG: MATE family efflux transporter [Muribaculaceae bacterium]|nr:MATE family efflux transporter [Muribaculaceae bacterium]
MTIKKYFPYYKSIALLALPLLLGQFGNIAVSFADNIMVGHYSTDALASASFVNNFFNIAIFACVGFTYGLTPLIGAVFARGDNDRIGRMVRVGLRVNIAFTLIVTALMTAMYFNIHRLGQPEHLLPLIRPYYLIVLAGMLPVCVFNVLAQWSFAIGNTGLPTWIVLAANGINIIGNYILIYGNFGMPELGLIGAGISTFTARILCAAAMLYVFFRCRLGAPYRHGYTHGRRVAGLPGEIVRTGFPVSMQMTFETASFSGAAVMAGWLGANELAAFQIVVISGMFGFCLYYSIGAALAIPVSHAAGAGDYTGMRRSAWAGYHIILATMTAVICLFIFCGHTIMGIFSDDSAVIALAVTLLVPMALYQAGDATQITFANALRGTSHVMPMLYIAFVSYIIVGLPVTYLLAFPCGLGLYGIVLSFSVCLMLAAVLFLIFFLRATRRKSTEKY